MTGSNIPFLKGIKTGCISRCSNSSNRLVVSKSFRSLASVASLDRTNGDDLLRTIPSALRVARRPLSRKLGSSSFTKTSSSSKIRSSTETVTAACHFWISPVLALTVPSTVSLASSARVSGDCAASVASADFFVLSICELNDVCREETSWNTVSKLVLTSRTVRNASVPLFSANALASRTRASSANAAARMRKRSASSFSLLASSANHSLSCSAESALVWGGKGHAPWSRSALMAHVGYQGRARTGG
eukprot:CAMPEP_0119212148 /NCGR_PEP_ID=MMETSP1327-20130426/3543_1 /TAXON_ID=38833 /ORGANISM="Micromonas pusilla, Strain RCC2306" /LENGTH=246 /DNA_ID=CAMNT_0007209337 /DNA_START=75 /DNA_END=812 /DNA_ORIENTATION=+